MTSSSPPGAAAAPPIETDALIVGAGPVGLFQVFELGLQDIRAHVVDALPHVGGQCAELYADKPIYDIPGVPVCTGHELVERLQQQIAPFSPTLHLGQELRSLARTADGRFDCETSTGTRFLARTVFVAGGVGSFQPKTLRVAGIERLAGRQLFYRVRDAAAFAGRHLVIAGGGDSAVDWALHFAADGAQRAASVTLLHRRDEFRAAPAQVRRLAELRAAGTLRVVIGQITGFETEGETLARLQLMTADGGSDTLALEHLLVFHGLSPRLGPIADWGLELEHRLVTVNPASFETNVPGVFAVGDICHYPGKRKLILCGFHEATLAAFAAVPYVDAERRVLLQYTTSSPQLHRLLGVTTPSPD
ncbi:ferredoxin--NADP(+) reductase [Rubrivivax gelatinosus]|uniref:NAD(P)/FAD-dependent oxidoreductase n=1 Tax=Rubrivivax gelatinosus TaxID=28068 RepID=UPI0019031048|nr:NAD(P)/FAD-dependent oxidoreductase [Rubrivivax gelatinosus]MBK1611931.1 ferredoxin--NADP(+) reductase [Rubrivivax gelatinosus]